MKILFPFVLLAFLLSFGSYVLSVHKKDPTFGSSPITASLQGKTAAEKAELKAQAIDSGKNLVVNFTREYGEYMITVTGVQKVDKGVAVYAKAWKNGKPVGFGKDGTIETERFVIINPPILVDDPNGTITRTVEMWDGSTYQRKLREDPIEAVWQVLVHNISIVGKDGSNIIPGSVGNTTYTFYPDANVESTSVDGRVSREPTPSETWATIRDAANGDGVFDALGNSQITRTSSDSGSGTWFSFVRSFYLFDTSSITDTETSIDTATLSIYGLVTTFDGYSDSVNVYSSNPASNTALSTADYDQVGTTAYATAITNASWNTAGYNNFTLNTDGKAAVTVTGVSKFSLRQVKDANNDSTWTASTNSFVNGYYADDAGSTRDPKLVIEASIPVSASVSTSSPLRIHQGFIHMENGNLRIR